MIDLAHMDGAERQPSRRQLIWVDYTTIALNAFKKGWLTCQEVGIILEYVASQLKKGV